MLTMNAVEQNGGVVRSSLVGKVYSFFLEEELL